MGTFKKPTVGILVKSIREGSIKKTAEFETFIKKGGWGQDFVQTKFILEIVTRGGVKNLYVKILSPKFFHFSTYFKWFFMVFFSICSILVKLSNKRFPFSANCTDLCSCTFKHLVKICHNFFRGGRG